MRSDRFRRYLRCLLAVATVGLTLPGLTAQAATIVWSGGGPDQNWTTDGTGGNWSGSAMPGPVDDAIFADHAGGGSAGAVTNVVDGSFTVGSLSYEFGSPLASFFHTTQIEPGGVLLASGGLNVAPDAGDTPNTNWTAHVTVTGSTATLQVGEAGTNTANMVVARTLGHHTTSSHSTGRLDLSGLGTFAANVNLLRLGQGIEWGSRGYAELTLAESNQINARTIETSRRVGHTNILLGQDNTIRTNTMYVNMGKAALQSAGISNEVRFQTGLTNPVLNLRGLDNEGANLFIAANVTNNTSGTSVGIVDVSGGTFNATFNDLTVGYFGYVYHGGAAGTLIMDDGLVTANNVMLARTNATEGSESKTTGVITMRGGMLVALGAVEDGGGVSTLNVLGGKFVSQGAVDLDNLNVGTAAGAAVFQLNGLAAGSRNVDTLALGANGNILLQPNPHGSGTIVATTANLAAGSTVEIGLPTGSSTDIADRTVWTAGTGNWEATQADWSNGLPAGYTIANNTAYEFLQAGTLTDNGLVLANSPGWSLSVTPGTNGTATVTRTGGDLTTGPRRAVIDDPAANVTRTDHLTVAEAAGADAAMLEVKAGQLTVGDAGDPKNLTLASGAAAGELLQSGGTVTVHGNVAGGGGGGTVNLHGGTLNVGGDFQVDNLAVGKENGSAILRLDSTEAVTHTIGSSVTLADGVGSTGTIRMLSGNLTVSGGISRGGGAGALHIDGGGLDHDAGDPIGTIPASVTVNGDLKVDELRVGYMHNEGGTIVGGKATLTVAGGDVEIGAGTGTFNVGRRVHSVSAHPQPDRFWGIADFSAATSVAIDVEEVWLGLSRTPTGGNPSPGPNTVGELHLSASGPNTIRAAEILAGDVPGGTGASPAASKVSFGSSVNDVQTDVLTLGGRKGWGEAHLAAGGVLTISGLTGSETDLKIGDNDVSTNSRSIGVLDTSSGTLNTNLGEVILGRILSTTRGYGRGTFVMGDGSVTAGSIRMAETPAADTHVHLTYGILQMVHNDGLFAVSGDITDGRGVGHLRIDAGTLIVGGSMNVDNVRVGHGGGTALLDLTGTAGTHSVGSAVTIAGGAGSTGTIRMAGGAFDLPALTDGGGTSTLDLPNGTMNVAGGFAVDNVWVAANDGTAVLDVGGAVTIGSGAGSTLNVAVVAAGGNAGGSGTLNFANAASVAIDVDTVRIANSGHGAGSTGLVQLSGGANTIRADQIVIGNRKGAATVNMAAGGSLDVQSQSGARANLTIGRNDIDTGGAPLATLDATAGVFAAQLDQLLLGHKSGGSAAGSGRGELLLGNSAANNVNVNNVVMAEVDGGGTATGRLQMSGGTFTVNGSISDGGGTSTIQLDGGTMTVGGGLQVDHLRVGYGGLSASLTVSGGPVIIGMGTEVFDIGNRDTVSGGTTSGTADFSAAPSVAIDVNRLGIAQIPGTGGTTSGTLVLPATGPASIRANVISVADIPSASGGGLGTMHLGAGTTDIDVDHFYLGYRKKSAKLDILPGGVLNIAGRSGAEANLYVGYNRVHTAGNPTGTMDLTGGTLNAVLNNLVVGDHFRVSNNNGSGTGILSFEAGTITANNVILGSSTDNGVGTGTVNMNGGSLTAGSITLGAGNANTSGTFNLAGGTLSAGSIVQGFAGSTTALNWTDGRLHVDQFGSSALPLDLLQQGGTLAPGNSIGTTGIFGDYTQLAAGVLEIEIAGPTVHDFVMVHGNASLEGTLDVLMLGGFEADLRDSFDVLQTTGDLTLGSIGITGEPPNPTFGWWQAAAVLGPGGEGAFLRLTVVPEPTTALLALLAIAALFGRRRRR